jgi:hypothetical protein
MKKIKTFLLLSLVFTLMTGLAQTSPAFVKAKGIFNRDASYTCPETSLFSQLPAPLSTGWYADDSYAFSRAGDDYTVTKPFTTMRFWGSNYYGCPIGTSQTFVIRFYERNVGDPNIPGNEIYSFTITVTPQPISLYYYPDYMVDVTFPTAITLLDGWVTLTRVYNGDGCIFVWLGQDYTGNSVSYGYDAWYPQGGQLAFCLGGGEKTPVSNWALILGVVLIGTFVFIRYRRMV